MRCSVLYSVLLWGRIGLTCAWSDVRDIDRSVGDATNTGLLLHLFEAADFYHFRAWA